jgi:hypothetical protein
MKSKTWLMVNNFITEKMKKILIGFSAFLVLVSCNLGVKSSNGMTAEDYHNTIVDQQNLVFDKIFEMFELIESNILLAEAERVKLVKMCDEAVEVVRALPDFNGDSEFRDVALEVFTFYQGISANEYKQMLDGIMGGDDAQIMNIVKMEEEINLKEIALDAKLRSAQSKFASKNRLRL